MFKLDACKIVFPSKDIVTCPRTCDGLFYIKVRALMTKDNRNEITEHKMVRSSKNEYDLDIFDGPREGDGSKLLEQSALKLKGKQQDLKKRGQISHWQI